MRVDIFGKCGENNIKATLPLEKRFTNVIGEFLTFCARMIMIRVYCIFCYVSPQIEYTSDGCVTKTFGGNIRSLDAVGITKL